MTITDPFTVPQAAPGRDLVECPHCGGQVVAVAYKVGPHNVQRFGPLRMDGELLTDTRGHKVYGVRVDETEPCLGSGQWPARPDRSRRKRTKA